MATSTFSMQSWQWSSNGQLAAAASQRRSSSLSWMWRQPRRRRGALQCRRQAQQQLTGVVGDRLGMSNNPGNFHPSVWGDFFIHYSSPTDSTQQQVDLDRIPFSLWLHLYSFVLLKFWPNEYIPEGKMARELPVQPAHFSFRTPIRRTLDWMLDKIRLTSSAYSTLLSP